MSKRRSENGQVSKDDFEDTVSDRDPGSWKPVDANALKDRRIVSVKKKRRSSLPSNDSNPFAFLNSTPAASVESTPIVAHSSKRNIF